VFISSSGRVSAKLTPLITAEETDKALKVLLFGAF